ncbi:hypothetical protein VYU27_007257 [Nannochloropsis oceanica]
MASRSLFFLAAAVVLCLANAFMLPSPLPLRAGSSARVLSTEDMSFDFGGRAKGGMEMMRHGKRFKKLGLPADQRKALLRALTTEAIRHGRIKTTLIRAKAVRKYVDKMIGLSKRGDLHARRQALGWMYDKDLVAALFEQAQDRYGERAGGYCRVLRTLPRKGDNAPMAILELV